MNEPGARRRASSANSADPHQAPTAAIVHSVEELSEVVSRLAGELTASYPGGVLLVALLKGSLFFLADLVRQLRVPCQVDFLALTAYGGGRVVCGS